MEEVTKYNKNITISIIAFILIVLEVLTFNNDNIKRIFIENKPIIENNYKSIVGNKYTLEYKDNVLSINKITKDDIVICISHNRYKTINYISDAGINKFILGNESGIYDIEINVCTDNSETMRYKLKYSYDDNIYTINSFNLDFSKNIEVIKDISDTYESVDDVFRYLCRYQYEDIDGKKLDECNNGLYKTDIYETYINKKGMCLDLSSLFAETIRYKGIPCKLLCGYIDESLYHSWCEVYTESGWKVYDIVFGRTYDVSEYTNIEICEYY